MHTRGDHTLMSFAQLSWEISGNPQRNGLTDEQRSAIRAGHISAVALLFPVPSKCDPDGSTFGGKAIPFPVVQDDLESPGSLLLRLEEQAQPLDRRRTPIFADPSGSALVGSGMDRALRDALLQYNPAVAATRSYLAQL